MSNTASKIARSKPTDLSARRARTVRSILDRLEPRRFLSNTPHVLSGGALSQDWTNTGLITANDNWDGVPSFEGFSQDGGIAAGTNPQTLTGTTFTTKKVLANQTNPNSTNQGGLTEFETMTAGHPSASNPSIGLVGSGSQDSPYLVAYLNTVGIGDVSVQYKIRDLESGADNALIRVALQYRVGGTGTWTDYADGFREIPSTGANTVRPDTNVAVTIPGANIGGQSLVEIRWIIADAAGNDEAIGIDDIVISGGGITPQPGQFSIEESSYTFNENAGTVTFVVERTGGSAGAVSVNYATSNGTAIAPGDYTSSAGTLNFADGVTSQSFTVSINDDGIVETTERFNLTLSNPLSGASLGTTPTATVDITDNDVAGTLAFNPISYTVSESGSTATLIVERTVGSAGAVSVNWAAIGGTATNPADYTSTGGTLNFSAGQTTAQIVINLVNDATAESSEQFTVTLSAPTGGALLGTESTATITIIDDDSTAPVGLLLNEININPPSSDQPYQYVEVRGTPGAELNNLFLVELEGDNAQNPGKINSVLSLAGATIGSNGLLLIRSANGFAAENGATGVLNVAEFDAGGAIDFQPGSASFVLWYDVDGTAPTIGTDLDSTNTGTLALPPTATALDVVGVLDGSNNDRAYGAVLGPIGTNLSPDAPDALSRFYNNVTPSSAAAWFWGNLTGGTSTKTFTTVAAQLSPNFPLGGLLTPGGVMTGVVSAVLDYAGSSQSMVVTFSEDVGASIAASDFELTNLTTTTAVTLNVISISPDGTVVRLGFVNGGGLTSSLLANGDYQLRVKAGEVGDGTNVLAIDSLSNVFFMNADFNHDRSVNFDDLLILAQNYGTTANGTFAGGDANYDGKVDFDDLLLLAQRYGTTLVTLAPPATKTPVKSRASFGKSVIA